MSIASKLIAGCSPIAGGACVAPVILEIEFFGPTSQVFTMFMQDSSGGEGDCISAHAYHDAAVATPHYDVTVAPRCPDETTSYPCDDTVSTQPWQKCKEAA